MTRDLHLVILAGGSGSRARGEDDEVPKQFREIGGTPMVLWSVMTLLELPAARSLTVTCPTGWLEVMEGLLDEVTITVPWRIVPGGDTRTASTWNALEALADSTSPPAADDLVAVHDAARPFASAELLGRLAEAAARSGGALPVLPVVDTTILCDPRNQSITYLPRADLRAVQTPQVFLWNTFFDVHRKARSSGAVATDDGGLMAAAGHAPVLVEGETENIKITTPEDLEALEELMGDGS